MKKSYLLLVAAGLLLLFASCSKDAQSTKATSTTSATSSSSKVISSTEAISLAVTDSSGSKDTLYAVKCYPPGGKPDSIAFSGLPSSVGTYLTANYSGYTFLKAFKTITPSNTTDGYVVVIMYDGKPVALKFDASGTFETVLEQMDMRDMQMGQPWHPGGPFGNRNGPPHDTVALSALPSTITAYFTANYPADTLLHANINPDSSYTVISKDDGFYATTFSSSLKFIARIKIMPPAPQKPVKATDLPASITTYLTTTYPGYVFNNAFELLKGSTVENYIVFINANNTSYSLTFDGSGNFVNSITLH
jgi:hypothetical protein